MPTTAPPPMPLDPFADIMLQLALKRAFEPRSARAAAVLGRLNRLLVR